MNLKLLAIDVAKNVFQLHGNDQHGNCIFKKRVVGARDISDDPSH